jgi:hypothetical protein
LLVHGWVLTYYNDWIFVYRLSYWSGKTEEYFWPTGGSVGFPEARTGFTKGKSPGFAPGPSTSKLERRTIYMILMLVKLRSFFGWLAVLIVWTRKGRR